MSFYLPKYTDPIEAIEWKKNGDIPGDGVINNINQGAIVGYAIPTKESTLSNAICPLCNLTESSHGILRVGSDKDKIVCPGDFIILIRKNNGRILDYKLMRQREFNKLYQLVTKEEAKQWAMMLDPEKKD
ncbi:hypothetical protein [Pseudomonas phage pPA-N1803-4At.2]|nr:hypothetical protein [Pseudomonas phage pPA-N1803-4At.2]